MGKGKTSKVWNFFTKVDNITAKCNICARNLSMKSGSSSNLTRHLTNKHSVSKDDEIEYQNENEVILSNTSILDSDVESQDNVQIQIPKRIFKNTMQGKGKTSCAWTFFTQIEKGKVKCSLCEKILSMKSSSSFNLFRHLRSKHGFVEVDSDPLEILEDDLNPSTSPAAKKISLSQSQSKVNVVGESVQSKILKQNSDVTNALFKTFVKSCISFELVESIHFKQFVMSLKPGYQIPTTYSLLSTQLPQYITSTKESIGNSLKSCTSLCLTMDSWTSVTDESYIATTCHFIDEDWNFISHMLDCCIYSKDLSSDYLTSEVKRIATEWDIEDRIEAIVTADIPSIVNAIKAGDWKHLPCFVQTLNSILKSALLEIEILQQKIQSIVHCFRTTSEAANLLTAMQKQLSKPVLELIHSTTTSWSSTYDMFMRLLEVQEPLTSVMIIHFQAVDQLTTGEFKIIQQCCELLEVFKDVTLELEGDKYVTCTTITLLSKGLIKFCNNYLKNNSDLTDDVVRVGNSLLLLLTKHFSNLEYNSVFANATFLDPRFKKHGFTDADNFENAKKTITQELISLSTSENHLEVLDEFCTFGTSSKSKLWDDFDNNVSELIGTSNPNVKIASSVEIKNYIEEPLLLRTNNPFTWWKERKTMYPRLTNLARKKLCVVGTSVPSESIFSQEGQIEAAKRLALTGDNVSQIVFLNANM